MVKSVSLFKRIITMKRTLVYIQYN